MGVINKFLMISLSGHLWPEGGGKFTLSGQWSFTYNPNDRKAFK